MVRIFSIWTFCLAILAGSRPAAAVELLPAAPVAEYAIHADGGLVYDPLRRQAQQAGRLDRWTEAPVVHRSLRLDGFAVDAWVPREVRAYDVVPIDYRLRWTRPADAMASRFPVAVEAVAFEDVDRRQGRNLYDLALPGRIDLDLTYLGSITAHLRPDGRHNLAPDFSDSPGHYPPFDREPMVRSGVVQAGDLVWFKFRYTNTGDTILDPEGMGGSLFYPQLLRRAEDGEFRVVGGLYNLYGRDTAYLYPGESHEIWFNFYTQTPNETPQNVGLVPGEYVLRIRLMARDYKQFDEMINLWDGRETVVWEQPISVEDTPREAPVPAARQTLTSTGDPDRITRFLHTFEEFMTAFDCHQSMPQAQGQPIDGTLHVQVAPWTRHIVLKLIATHPLNISTIAVPVRVNAKGLAVAFDPDPPACVIKDGLRTPIIMSQTMADMRANIQLGPFPECHIRRRLREMKDCGINVLATTSMPWLYSDMHRPAANHQGDAWKYLLDCAREEGVGIEGWGAYPFDRGTIAGIAKWISGRTFEMTPAPPSYPGNDLYISHTDPQLPEANALAMWYQFKRWGDLYDQFANGDVPISVEDTRGWLRDDVNTRFAMGKATVEAFRDWLRAKYENIDRVNEAWGTDYASFEAIDPQAGVVENRHGHRWEYTNRQAVFHDWSVAVADLDIFRTELRAKNYLDTLRHIRKHIPQAVIALRTEGANVIVAGLDPTDPNPHYRHIYYSQRRCAIIAEVLQRTGAIALHSDYTTMPYTPAELRFLVRAAVKQGVVPAWLPQFDHMRDIAINAKYGNPYEVHYNLPEPRKGCMMHRLVAVYPWFQAVYEEGGIPGVLWEDYQCDGFVTETQKRELRLFREHLQRAIRTPQALRARREVGTPPDEAWRASTRAMRSYHLDPTPCEDGW